MVLGWFAYLCKHGKAILESSQFSTLNITLVACNWQYFVFCPKSKAALLFGLKNGSAIAPNGHAIVFYTLLVWGTFGATKPTIEYACQTDMACQETVLRLLGHVIIGWGKPFGGIPEQDDSSHE